MRYRHFPFLSIATVLVPLLFLSCQRASEKKDSGSQGGRLAALDTIRTPVWSDADFPPPPRSLFTFEVTSNQRPVYSPGQGEFRYVAKKVVSSAGMGGSVYTTYSYIIDGFTTEFSYEHSRSFLGLPCGARTYDGTGRLRAEAVTLRIVKEEGQPLEAVEIREFHYDALGSLIFTCKSRIEPGKEWKVSEYESLGVKERDYYPVWPISRHH